MTVLIVDGSLVGFAENFVSLLGFLEFLFGFLVAGIAVRVVLHRQTAIGLLDVGLGRGARNIEHLVVIAFRHFPPLEKPPRTIGGAGLPGPLGLLLVFDFFELGVDRVVVGLRTAATRASTGRSVGSRAASAGLSGLRLLRDVR